VGIEPEFERSPSDGAKYELLRSLSHGKLGPLALGRVSGESDAGRFVTLRSLPAADFAGLEVAVRRAASIAHPRLVKVLGLAWIDEVPYLASEYVDGLSIGDLTRALRATETSVMQAVALRIGLDVLLAINDARAELGQRGVSSPPRCLYPDTAWIATFGETLLSDVGVAGELASYARDSEQDRAWSAPGERDASSAQADVFATGALLFELLSGSDLASVRKSVGDAIPALDSLPLRGPPIAKELVELVARALALEPRQRFSDPEQMARAIVELPSHWLGSEAQVSAAIEPLAHRAADLKASEPSLELSSGEHLVDDPWEIPTRSLRLRVPCPEDDRQTLRPEPAAQSVEPSAPAPKAAQSSADDAPPPTSRQPSIAKRIARKMRLIG
jgi:serine/threonine protein kinase